MYKTELMNLNNKAKSTIDDDWEKFLNGDCDDDEDDDINNDMDSNYCENELCNDFDNINNNKIQYIPKCSDIYISTKTKIAYLNKTVDLNTIFWKIPIIPYAKPCDGVIKKQIKFKSICENDLNFIKEKLQNENCFEEHIIKNINNPNGRIKFKDIRKVSIGVSKKDLTSYRCKKKSAFDNCFVLILRLNIEETFKEFHVKVFNTGKLELPGIQNDTVFNLILENIVLILKPYLGEELGYKENTTETILINSNFNCGYYINREKLFNLLKYKYKIQAIYDPCSYPGIQSKFHYDPLSDSHNGIQTNEKNDLLEKKNNEVSFMIFRTGSVLIVGKCDEKILFNIYDFLKNILTTEYKEICEKGCYNNFQKKSISAENDDTSVDGKEQNDSIMNFNNEKDNYKKKKTRRKQILINVTSQVS